MKKILYKLKIGFQILLASTLMAPAGILAPVSAISSNNMQNPAPVSIPEYNGLELSKTAEAVPGYANLWDITLRIKSPKTTKTSDTVIVIDRSGSMNEHSRMTAAKKAAKTLVHNLLSGAGQETNRIALVSFAGDVTKDLDFTNNATVLNNKITGLSASGGTFTQAGMRSAKNLISGSTADIKSIILLSDGVPTYNYQIDNPDNFLINGGPGNNINEKQTSTAVPENQFLYGATKIGAGNSMWYKYHSWKHYYYNSGNCAIAEAGFYKNSNIGSLYTIALEAGNDGNNVLRAMASPGKSYTATPEELEAIFKEIGGSINNALQNPSVTDAMGEGFVVVDGGDASITADGKTLTWQPKAKDFVQNDTADGFTAELTYRVKLDQDILSATNEAGFYPANTKATLSYSFEGVVAEPAEFPIPKVKPTFVRISKQLKNQEWNGRKFDIKITEPANNYPYNGSYTLGENDQETIYKPLRLGGGYTVAETGTSNNDTALLQYDTTYEINGMEQQNFTIEEGTDVNIKVKNTYNVVKRSVQKIWNGKKADSVSVTLHKGNDTENVTLSENNGWKHDFGNLPVKDINGNVIDYRISEEEMEQYETHISIPDNNGLWTITNTYIPEKVDVKVQKVWSGGATILNPEAKINLLRNGLKIDSVTLTRTNSSHIFRLLDKTDIDGNEYVYTVVEDSLALWTPVVTNDGLSFNITNTYISPKIAKAEAKKIWVGGDSLTRPTIWLKLYRNVEGGSVEAVPESEAEIKQLTDGTEQAVWDNLTENDGNGYKYIFSVKEVDADGNDFTPRDYIKTEDGLQVTNTYVSPKTDIKVKKTWVNGPAIRPDITIHLLQNGERVETVKLMSGRTEYIFRGYDLKDATGVDYVYTVEEDDVANYEISYALDPDTLDLIITNTYNAPVEDKAEVTDEIRVPNTGKGYQRTGSDSSVVATSFGVLVGVTSAVALMVVIIRRKMAESK